MYQEADLVRIAKRENNNKRKYLVVNRLQGKHIPVKPKEAFQMFGELAATIKNAYEGERLLLIGFAETATAIGAAVAVELGTSYIQTTREIIPGVEYLFFSEEHSHATEQKLVKNDIDSAIEDTDRIIFIEDEVTTGKTILNIIAILEKMYPDKVSFSVASLLNGMDESALHIYKEKNIKLHYLVKTNHDRYTELAEGFAGDGCYVPCNTCDARNRDIIPALTVDGWMNARRLVAGDKYAQACQELWTKIKDELQDEWHNELSNELQDELHNQLHNGAQPKVLVLGTEEFMYPALFVANRIEQTGAEVACHSTTRSPIAVSTEEDYPLHTRYELKSLYDKDRTTYIYDIGSYDVVLIVTDAHNTETEGLHSLVNAVRHKNEKIYLVRWC